MDDEDIVDVPIHKTQPWVSVWILSLTGISPSTSSFRARFEFNVFWELSASDTKSYKNAIRTKTIADWNPTWQPNFIPVNVSSVESMERETFANGKQFVIFKQKDGTLAGRYVLLLDAVFTELFNLSLFPYDVQGLSMDVQYHSYPQAYQNLIPGSGDVDLAKSNIKIHEKCLSSAEWIFHSVQLGFGVWKQQVRINVKVQRRWQYYVYRIAFVLALITLVSCFTCFNPSDTINGQFGYLSACLLICVAYLYVAGEAVPKLPFLTILDYYIYACILYVAGLMVQSCILTHLDIGRRANGEDVVKIFGVDFAVWLIIQVSFFIRSRSAKDASESQFWIFPQAMVFKERTDAPTRGYGGKLPSGGCVAFLDKDCQRADYTAEGKEVYQQCLPSECAHIWHR